MLYCDSVFRNELFPHAKELETACSHFLNGEMRAMPNEEMRLIDDGRIKLINQEYTTMPLAQCAWETHNRYYDVMYIDEGEEMVGVLPRKRLLAVRTAYDEVHDITWYEGAEGPSYIVMRPGDMLIISPNEGHLSRAAVNQLGFVRKFVAKIKKK